MLCYKIFEHVFLPKNIWHSSIYLNIHWSYYDNDFQLEMRWIFNCEYMKAYTIILTFKDDKSILITSNLVRMCTPLVICKFNAT